MVDLFGGVIYVGLISNKPDFIFIETVSLFPKLTSNSLRTVHNCRAAMQNL